MARRHERTEDRRQAAQVLYSGLIRDKDAKKLLENDGILCLDKPMTDYSFGLVEGVEAHRPEIDERISSTSENWTIDRMPLMDLIIMRIAVYEMLYAEDVPISVSINEAVELAKFFGGDDESPRFVNGMLGNIARSMETEEKEQGASQ